MKKTALHAGILLLLGGLLLNGSGCEERNFRNTGETSENNQNRKITDTEISPDVEIRKINNNFSAVGYNGDYGFDSFLEQGGADSDSAVLSFLRETLLAEADGLSFEGAVFGCSTLSVPSSEGGYLFGRNFDWMNCNIMVVSASPVNGYKSVSTVNMDFIRYETEPAIHFMPDRLLTVAALYAPLDGMNEKGLCVAVNMIEDYSSTIEQNTEKPDITTTTAIRLLLDKAANVEEAVNLLEFYDLHASFGYMIHFAIADADGNSVAVEYVGNEMKVIKTPVLTNFYLAEGEKKGIGSAQSHTRYDILTKLLVQSGSMNMDDVRDALSRVSKRNFEEFLSTEWSIVFDQENLKAQYYHREDYNQSYSFLIQ